MFIASVLLTSVSMAQTQYRISGLTIRTSKSTQEGRNAFQFTSLGWGKVVSKCISPKGAETGLWFTYRPKDPNLTVTVRTGKGWGSIEDPIIYIGTEIENKGQTILKELTCTQGEDDDELIASLQGLELKKEYYILVTAKHPEKNQRFSLQLSPTYTEMKPAAPAVVEQPKGSNTEYIIGRIRHRDGSAKAGVVVSLLDENMERIEEAKTDPEGSFRFEKLPLETTLLTRIEEDDSELIVDMFLYDKEGNVKQRSSRIGSNLYGFGAEKGDFKQLKLLTSMDWSLNVKKGKSGVTGRVVDAKTFLYGQKGMEVGLYNKSKSKLASSVTDAEGRFVFRDVEKGDYMIKVEKPTPGTYSEMVVVDDLNVPFMFSNSSKVGADGFFEFEKLPAEIVEMKRMQEQDTRMKLPTDFSKMEDGKPIVLKNILFASGSAKLLESSYGELDKLAMELTKRPAVNIEISGHTDNVGGEKSNQILSENRAKAVRDYLVTKGIAEGRLSFKGYGQAKPVAGNDMEEGRKQNRRVEFVVKK